MKKFLIAIVMLIPIIVVATVGIATSIVSTTAYIAVDNLKLPDKPIELDIRTKKYTVEANIYPENATNKNIKWEIEQKRPTNKNFDGEIAEIDSKTGEIKINTYGNFKVVATTEEGNKKDSCLVIIKGDELESVNIIDINKNNKIAIGESAKINFELSPVDVLVENINWQIVSGGEYLSIDKNGVITAKKAGTEKIMLTVTDKHGNKVKQITTVTITKSLLSKSNIYTFNNICDLSQFMTEEDIVLTSKLNCTIKGNEVTLTDDIAKVIASKNGIEQEIIIKKCSENEIIIKNGEFFAVNEDKDYEGYFMKVNSNILLYLNAVYLDSFKNQLPKIDWISENPEIASVENGEVKPISEGVATIIAQTENGENAKIKLLIVKPVTMFDMDIKNDDNQRGIANERVWGNTFIEGNRMDGAKVHSYKFNITYPNTLKNTDLIWEIDKNAKYLGFSINENGVLTIPEKLDKKMVCNISAYAKYPSQKTNQYVYKYNMTFDNGINIIPNVENKVNVVENEELNKLAFDMLAKYTKENTIMLHSDCYAREVVSYIKISSIYGNGYHVSNNEKMKENENVFNTFLNINKDNVFIKNAIIRSHSIKSNNIVDGSLKGKILEIRGEKGSKDLLKNIVVEHSVIENGYFGMEISNANVLVDGCILRNASAYLLNMKQDTDILSNVTLNNVIVSNSLASSIGVVNNNENPNGQTQLNVTGFFDSYNWQTAKNIAEMTNLGNDEGSEQAIKNLATSVINNLLSSKKVDSFVFVKKENNKKNYYANLGIAVIDQKKDGKKPIVIFTDDNKLDTFSVEIDLTWAGFYAKLTDYSLKFENQEDFPIKPGDIYTENEELYAKLRG